MSEHKVQGSDMLLFIDPNGGTAYDIVVCLTSVGVSDSVSVVDASSACGPDKSPGTLEISYTFEGQHLQDPISGKISGSDLRFLLRDETTIGWMMAPEIPVAGDEIHTGTGYLSELSSTYSFDSVGTFTGTIQPYGEPVITIEGGGGGLGLSAQVLSLNNTFFNGNTISVYPVVGQGGTSPYSYAISPSLPTGLSFDISTCEIYGTPTSNITNTTFTITVTDDASATANANVNIEVRNLAIGDIWAGGKVAYLDGLGGGFVVAPTGYLTSVRWGVKATTGATSAAIGDGGSNTAIITAASVGVAGSNTYFCFVFNQGGYTDWVIPSSDEMQEIKDNQTVLGVGFTSPRWTSTEDTADNAFIMTNGGLASADKSLFNYSGTILGLYIRYF
jgi:hypothetical protein